VNDGVGGVRRLLGCRGNTGRRYPAFTISIGDTVVHSVPNPRTCCISWDTTSFNCPLFEIVGRSAESNNIAPTTVSFPVSRI
jgi:hypothetical protein